MTSFEDCTICLDEMRQSDVDHPLQCDTHCGFNFCKNCIESLITSSKDDYMEASDGNRHVKVFLHCPNCRADLSHTIRDTLLLRKADASRYAEDAASQFPLTASQLQLRNALQQPEVQAAIAQARRLEAEFLGREYKLSPEKQKQREPQLEYEEWGFEMDLVRGVHQSFRMPKPPPPKVAQAQPKTKCDPSLFAGLDYFLSEDERFFVTDLMTSGDPENLAKSAQILYSVSPIRKDPQKTVIDCPQKPHHSSSVLELIAESEEAHLNHDVKEMRKILGKPVAPPVSSRVAEHRVLDRDLKHQAHFKKNFPVPVRMPKCIEIDFREIFELQFVDDVWDGTVMDAYSKLSIGYSGTVTQYRPDNRNVFTVLGKHGTSGDIQIELPGQRRVLVSYTGRDAGQQGAVKGDVVTHINGNSVAGKGADLLLIRINAAKQRGERKLTMTLNAERSVAEALKRRAISIAEIWQSEELVRTPL